jgi:hypothetical protein
MLKQTKFQKKKKESFKKKTFEVSNKQKTLISLMVKPDIPNIYFKVRVFNEIISLCFKTFFF